MSHRPSTARHGIRGFRGFTLIELLVVVAIIALLISILLPSLSRARETSRMVKCLAVHKQMGTANIMYADANTQTYVRFNTPTSQGLTIGGGFWGALIQYRQMLGIPVTAASGTTPGTGQRGIPDLMCPSKQPTTYLERGEWYRTFAFNAMGTGVWQGGNGAVNRARVTQPGVKVMGMDATNWNLTVSTQMRSTANQWDDRGDDPQPLAGYGAYRHLDSTTMVMHDGHAEAFTKVEAYDPGLVRIRLYDPYKLQ